ncbi:hypothetical protein [Lagierella sp.]|uniref:hypothetical protein n=1 Tax=Lagierella sp. TaxID=2849657 RepID=UPI0026095D36|nr:hypothetical protein [Lagierella sp.]
MNHIKVEIFVPFNASENLMKEINNLGVLKENNYDYCFSETVVKGHFRPLKGSNPTIGNIDKIEVVDERKLEFRIFERDLKKVHSCILKNHPYEVPVVNYIRLLEVDDED